MEFVCRVGTPDGRVLEQILEARDEAALRGDLQRRGFHLFEARAKGIPWSNWFARAASARIPARTFLIFNQELAALLKAGLPLLQALDLMLERLEHPRFRAVLGEIRERVKSGADLSEAFAAHGDLFPPLYAPSLKAGERTGELEQVIRRFVRYMKLMIEARRRVIGALVYPAVLVVLSIAMIAVMVVFVLPKFSGFFESLEADLPFATRFALGASAFLRAWWPVLVGSTVVAWWTARRWRRTAAGRATMDRWRLKLPVVGTIFQGTALSEFCRALATLLSGGIPLVQALEIAVSAVGNAWVRAQLLPTIDAVRQGGSFHAALERTELFESLEIDMVKVGEATGALDGMLQSVSEFLDEAVETRLQRLLTLIEPLMLVFMGVIIATLLISIYVPLFGSLGQNRF
jgi:type IV pilus assembly protein PilC